MFAVACLSLALTPPPVATITVSDPTRLAAAFGELLDTRVEFAPGRDLSAWRRGAIGFAALYGFEGVTGPTPPVVITMPMTAALFHEKVLTAAERESVPDGGSRFTDATGSVWHFAAAGDSVVISPDARLLGVRFRQPLRVLESLGGATLRIDLRRVRALAGKEIMAATQFVTLMLRTGGASWLKGFDARQRESAAKLVEGAHRVVADGVELWVALDPRPTGGGIAAGWVCRPGTPTANLLAAETPTALEEWRDLPLRIGGESAYPIAVRKLSPAVARALAGVNPEFAAAPGDAASARAITNYEERLTRAGLVTEVRGVVLTPDPDGELGKSYEAALRTLKKGASYRNLPLRAAPELHATPGSTAARIPLDFEAATGGIADPNLRRAAFASIEKLTPPEPVVSFGTDAGQFFRASRSRATPAAMLRPDARAGVELELMRARAMLPEKLSAFVGLDMADALKSAAEFGTTIETAVPAFPGWELPAIDARVLRRGETPFAAGVRLSPKGVTMGVGLPTAALRMAWAAIEK